MHLMLGELELFIFLNFVFMFLYYTICVSYVRNNILRVLFLFEILILIFSFMFLLIGFHYNDIYSHVVVIYLLSIAAVEASIGLALIYSYYRLWRTVKISSLSKIKG
jgi:NADH-quinone oxidoreductase subunit K